MVQAARELFNQRNIRPIHRARAATEPAINEITRIIHEAARTKTRRLVLLTGIPGAGKTLVGLQIAHAPFLDDLSIERADGKPTVPAVFLSGNDPLVAVLQYELRRAGGSGRTFVRRVKDYVSRYSARPGLVPPEHVLIFDEAQRAFDAKKIQETHDGVPGFLGGKSESEHLIEFAERIPEWCVVIGLIGNGQEINVGEEGGLGQWRIAVDNSSHRVDWRVHIPEPAFQAFGQPQVEMERTPLLNLDREIRFHFATDLYRFVGNLLAVRSATENAAIAIPLEKSGYHLRLTRDLDVAKQYLRDRYENYPEARFGIIASARDKDLERFGVANDYQSTKRVKIGPWYSDNEPEPGSYSCRHLREAITEFGAQGLELDAALLAWGTDFQLAGGCWSNTRARGYKRGAEVKNPLQLRINAYRVLLTRGRDATVVFVPPLQELDATYAYLRESGFKELRKAEPEPAG